MGNKERGSGTKRRAKLTLRMTGALQRSSQSGFGPSLLIRREWPVIVSSVLPKKKSQFFRGGAAQSGAKKTLAGTSQQVFNFGKRTVASVRSRRNQLRRLHELIPEHVMDIRFYQHVG